VSRRRGCSTHAEHLQWVHSTEVRWTWRSRNSESTRASQVAYGDGQNRSRLPPQTIHRLLPRLQGVSGNERFSGRSLPCHPTLRAIGCEPFNSDTGSTLPVRTNLRRFISHSTMPSMLPGNDSGRKDAVGASRSRTERRCAPRSVPARAWNSSMTTSGDPGRGAGSAPAGRWERCRGHRRPPARGR